jgi:hypothetical protein
MLLIDMEEENSELDDEWLPHHELQDQRCKKQGYHQNQAIQGITQQNQQELHEDANKVPEIQVDNEDSNDNDNNDHGD